MAISFLALIFLLLLIPGKSSAARGPYDWYNMGLRHLIQFEYSDAISDFSEAIRAKPDFAKAFYQRGYGYFCTGNLAYAKNDFSSANRNDAEYSNSRASLGNCLRLERDLAGALTNCNDAVNLAVQKDEMAWAYCARGLVYLDQNKYTEALADFEKAIANNGSFVKAIYGRGIARSYLGQYPEAISDQNQAITLDSQLAAAYCGRARALIKSGKFDEALPDIRQALSIDPKFNEAFHLRGKISFAKGEFEQALRDFDSAIMPGVSSSKRSEEDMFLRGFNQQPNAEMYFDRAELRTFNKDYSAAVKDYTEAVNKEKNNRAALMGRGVANLNLNNPADAKNDFTSAIDIADKPDARSKRGLACVLLGEFDSAIEDLTDAIVKGDENPDNYFYMGRAYLGKNAFDQALRNFDLAIGTGSKNSDAYLFRAEAHVALDHTGLAFSDFSQAILLNPESIEALVGQAVIYVGKGNFDGVIGNCNKVLSNDPGNATASCCRGKAYAAKGQHSDAVKDYTNAINSVPGRETQLFKPDQLYFERGVEYYQVGDYKSATADFGKAIEKNANVASYYGCRGEAYFQQKLYIDAAASFQSALDRVPGKTEIVLFQPGKMENVRLRLANCYLQQEQYDKAIREFSNLINNGQPMPEAFQGRGNAYFGLENYALAEENYKSAIDRSSGNLPEPFFLRGNARFALGNFSQAVEDYGKAIGLDNTDPEYQAAMGNALRENEKPQDASPYFDFAVNSTPPPGNAKAYADRAYNFYLQGNLELAMQDCEQAIRNDPNCAWAYCVKGNIYHRKKEYIAAIREYGNAIAKDEKLTRVWYDRGRAHFALKDNLNALQDFSHAIEVAGKDYLSRKIQADAYYNRGVINYNQEDYQLAVDDFSKTLEFNADDQLARQALDRASKKLGVLPGEE